MELLVVIAIIATLAGVGVPALINKQKEGYRAEAIMNCNQIGKTLFSFDQDYGAYPDDDSAADITENLSPGVTMTGNANGYFRQLIAGGYIDQESPFYCRTTYTKKPDNDMESSNMLDAKEVGFAYIMKDATSGFSSSNNSAIPLAAAAMIDGSSSDFDPDVYNKKAVVLRIDTSVSVESINSQNEIVLRSGKTLLETGTGTPFGSSITSPNLVAPEY